MPQIFDNIEKDFLPTLQKAIDSSQRADFCVGYFSLRGWRRLDQHVERWPGGEGNCCRLLVGMHSRPQDRFISGFGKGQSDGATDNKTALRYKQQLAQEFREQLVRGSVENADEAGLRRLAAQLKEKKLFVKLFLRHQLHAKLYLVSRDDEMNPKTGYLGSSNLTLPGLSNQGELNVDVKDDDACNKLQVWFEDRWNDKLCVDISRELAEIIDNSWAGERITPPHHIYVKMAYHLSQEARAGLAEFRIPRDLEKKLLDFQANAVRIAAGYLNKRGGVLIGDVVGLGKTLMATALARIFEDDHHLQTLIICPKNLREMWEYYAHEYHLHARVLPISEAQNKLATMWRYGIVLVDESHNLRNRKGKRYRAIAEYIRACGSKVILLSATPYNKTYQDLSNQLRLFIDEDKDIGLRPENLLREIGESEFIRKHQCSPRSLAAFEKSGYPDDWRELMRLYLVRRTRGFIQENYAKFDAERQRKYLTFADQTRSYFPTRVPKTVKFDIKEADTGDQYARLFAVDVVNTINGLALPRYGLFNYQNPSPNPPPTATESGVLNDLSRAGIRLKGFCRTNLFKRLESSGHAFILSLERHVLRNFIFLHAISSGLPLPIGTQGADLLDAGTDDDDDDNNFWETPDGDDDQAGSKHPDPSSQTAKAFTEAEFRQRAAEVYSIYSNRFPHRFKWLPPALFGEKLALELAADADSLMGILRRSGEWDPARDSKLQALLVLLTRKHPTEKVLLFSQFADTVDYLAAQLNANHIRDFAPVTGGTDDPTGVAQRFSPASNGCRAKVDPAEELRIVLATDILSEGQNLQDCSIVVNYDLPWAIIRLIQRAGRVDRIGQKADTILCYSFLPAEGVERIINLRRAVRQRLKENAEVVGTDEAFFDDEKDRHPLLDIYNEKSGSVDGDEDKEVDLASEAYQIWNNAIKAEPELEKIIPAMPDVVYSTQAHAPTEAQPEGALVYLRTPEGSDALAWVDKTGKSVTESQFAILKAAACAPGTPGLQRFEQHHAIVTEAVRLIVETEKSTGGQLGRPSGARFRAYERLSRYAKSVQGSLFATDALRAAVQDIYDYPLLQAAVDTLSRQLKSGIDDHLLAELVVSLRQDGRLCQKPDDVETGEPRIICSMGLRKPD